MLLWVAAVIVACAVSTPSRAEDLVAVVDLTFVEATNIPSDVICAEREAEDCVVWGTLKIYRARITRVVAGVESRKSVLVLLGSHSMPARPIKNRVVKMRAIPAAKASEPQYQIVDFGTKRELYCFKDRGGRGDGYLLDAGSEQASRCYEEGVVDP